MVEVNEKISDRSDEKAKAAKILIPIYVSKKMYILPVILPGVGTF